MWVFLNNAMLSIVEGRDRDMLLVRARIEGDIERVFPEAVVWVSPDRDYRYRAAVRRELVGLAIAAEVYKIDYKNFKDSVEDDHRHDAYLQVWETMSREQQARLTR